MRKLMIIILATTIISCDLGEGETFIYTVENQSGKDIRIESYVSTYPNMEPVVTHLENGEKKTETYEDGLPPTEYNFTVFFGGSTRRDSIVVIYDNTRWQSYTINECNGNGRNPLDLCEYSNLQETFVFTTENYETAVE